MKIGDRVFVRGYIDEIRKDTVIIRNEGGYFGTVSAEVLAGELPSAQPEHRWIPCSERPPDEKTDVLLQFTHNMAVGYWEDVLGKKIWYVNSGDNWYTYCDEALPIAWMPLPRGMLLPRDV